MPTRNELLAQAKRKMLLNQAREKLNKKKGYSQIEAGARSAAQMASFGFADEAIGGTQALYDEYVEGKPGTYEERVRAQRDADAASAQQWPKTDMAVGLGTAAAMSLIPGGALATTAKGAKLAQYLKGLSAAKKAAAAGALVGAGKSTSNPLEGLDQAGQFAKDVGAGAATGAVGQKAFSGLSKGIQKIPGKLREAAQERAVKAGTGQSIAHLRKIGQMTHKSPGDIQKYQDKLRKTGQDILDETTPSGERLLKAGDRVEDIAPKAADTLEKYGKEIGRIGKGIDAMHPEGAVSVDSIINKLSAAHKGIKPLGPGKTARNALTDLIDDIKAEYPSGKMSFADAQNLKGQFKFNALDKDVLVSNKRVSNQINRIISGEMDETVSGLSKKFGQIPKPGPQVVGDAAETAVPAVAGAAKKTPGISPEDYEKTQMIKGLLDDYGKIKGKYQSFKNITDASTDRAARNLTNRMVSPSDYAMGATGAITGAVTGDPSHLLVGVLAAGAHKLVRERGNSAAARTLDKLARMAENSPEFAKQFLKPFQAAAERGPAALVATHMALMKNPEYKAHMENQK